jgi:hypothetical protein
MIAAGCDKRAKRVVFENPLHVRVMAIDGTWVIDGQLIDVSEAEARIRLASPATKDIRFFLLLTKSGGPVFRMCIRKWVKGTLMEVSFQKDFVEALPLAQPTREAEPKESFSNDSPFICEVYE